MCVCVCVVVVVVNVVMDCFVLFVLGGVLYMGRLV